MHIITRKRLLEFAKIHPDCSTALESWYRIVKRTDFNSFICCLLYSFHSYNSSTLHFSTHRPSHTSHSNKAAVLIYPNPQSSYLPIFLSSYAILSPSPWVYPSLSPSGAYLFPCRGRDAHLTRNRGMWANLLPCQGLFCSAAADRLQSVFLLILLLTGCSLLLLWLILKKSNQRSNKYAGVYRSND